jgi:hypothetical protein
MKPGQRTQLARIMAGRLPADAAFVGTTQNLDEMT